MEKIMAIDVMNYPRQCRPDLANKFLEYGEYKNMTVLKWPPPGTFSSIQEMIAEMDEVGYDRIIISPFRPWSHMDQRLINVYDSIDIVKEIVDASNGRVVGACTYNPLKIIESLQEIEKGVREYGFKYVYFHAITFDIALDDRKLYPCYAKCAELGVSVGMQTGHSAELMPSWGGQPIYLDRVALDFPDLKIVMSHTGWPWVDEWIALVRKHPNVYGDISAWPAKMLPRMSPQLIDFMDSRLGQEKVLFGTNGMGLRICKDQFLELPISDSAKKKILRDNALQVFDL